jgi:hypothetical protein
VARTNRRPPIGDAAVRVRMGPAHRRGSFSPTVAVSTLLLVVGASSGGVVTAAPDQPGEGEHRVDRWAPHQAGQQPTQLDDRERDHHASGHHDGPPSPSWLSGRRTRVTAKNASTTIARLTCRYRPGAGGPGSGPARPRPWLARTPPRPAPPAGDPHQRDQRGGGRGEAGVVGQLVRVAEAEAGQQPEPHPGVHRALFSCYCTAASRGRLTEPRDCEGAHHAWWRRARLQSATA